MYTIPASTGNLYAYIYAADSHRGDIAKLESDTIIATQQQCLSFWYFKTNSRDKVHLLKNDLHLLNLSNYIGKEWHRLQVPLGKTSHNSYKLVFKVERGKNSDGSFGAIVIDDILIANQHCHCKYRLLKLCNYIVICIYRLILYQISCKRNVPLRCVYIACIISSILS